MTSDLRASDAVAGQRTPVRRALVVGNGAAGLMTTLALVRARVPVTLLSAAPSRAGSSSLDHEGFNAACHAADDPARHAGDAPSDGLGSMLRRSMAEAAPGLLELLEQLGVPFDRTVDGKPRFVRTLGHSHPRTAMAGANTGFHIVCALEREVRRYEVLDVVDAHGTRCPGEKWVERFEPWELVDLVQDERGVAVGGIAQHCHGMEMRAFPADAVCLATGGMGGLFDHAAVSATETGSALALALERGAMLVDVDRVLLWPTAYRTADRCFLVGDAARSHGARLWVPKIPADPRAGSDILARDREYFADDVTTLGALTLRVLEMCLDPERGLYDPTVGAFFPGVYQDATHLSPLTSAEVAPFYAHYRKFAGVDATIEPVALVPAIRRSLGGLWVDAELGTTGTLCAESPRSQATTLTGLYAAGAATCWQFGPEPLPGDELLACLFAGSLAASGMQAFRDGSRASAHDLSSEVFAQAKARAEARYAALAERGTAGSASAQSEAQGGNVFALRRRLRGLFRRVTLPGRLAPPGALDQLERSLDEIAEELCRAVPERSSHRALSVLRQTEQQLVLGRALGRSLRTRCERAAAGEGDAGTLSVALERRADGALRCPRQWGYDGVSGRVDVRTPQRQGEELES